MVSKHQRLVEMAARHATTSKGATADKKNSASTSSPDSPAMQ